MPEFEFHILANQFPLMSPDEFLALKKDIDANGLREPIVLFQRKILDGRNRYMACKELDITPSTEQFEGTPEEAAAFSASANLTRRHLTKSQKAMTVAMGGLVARPGSGGDGKLSIRSGAKRYGVNHMTIYKAFYVLDNDKELAQRVLTGELSVGVAENRLRERLTPDATHGDSTTTPTINSLSDSIRLIASATPESLAMLSDQQKSRLDHSLAEARRIIEQETSR